MLDNSSDGSGFTPLKTAAQTVHTLVGKYSDFGGVSGWEYFNAVPGAPSNPAEWGGIFADVMK
jgi:hypothetical protein